MAVDMITPFSLAAYSALQLRFLFAESSLA